MFDFEREFYSTLKRELSREGLYPSVEFLEHARQCMHALRRSGIPVEKARDVARMLAKIASMKVKWDSSFNKAYAEFLSILNSCRIDGYSLKRGEAISCPIIVPRGYLAFSLIDVYATSGVNVIVKKIGEAVEGAFYSVDLIHMAFFDVEKASWVQKLTPGMYLVQVNNYCSPAVTATLNVSTCVVCLDER